MKFRIPALLLALLMAGSCFACGSADQPEDTTASDTQTTAEPVSEGLKSGVPDDVKFEGETIRILNACYHDDWFTLLNVPEATGDTVDDAVYNRNLAVMDKLGITIEFTDMSDTHNTYTASKTFRQTVLAGDCEWDIMIGPQFRAVQLAVEDLFYNMIDAPYIDTEQPWWYADYMKSVNINDNLRYMLDGDLSLNFLFQTSAIYFNKDLMEVYHGDPDFLYDEVLAGKWTFDRFRTLVTDVYDDVNGNQKVDYEDLHGWVSRPNSYTMYTLMMGGGSKVVEETDNGWAITTDLERNIDLCEIMYQLVYETTGSYPDTEASRLDPFNDEFPRKFSEGTMLFHVGLIDTADRLREMEDSFGIIPFPKFDEAQESYKSPVQDQADTASVPSTIKNIDLTAAVLEEMAYQGYMTMIPEFYNIALKVKYMRDTDDAAMQIIDIIHDTAFTEIGFVHNYNMNNLATIPRFMLADKQNNYASRWDKALSAAQEKFANLMAFYNK
ncbi:MAG: hypothetical protein E7632_08965 [Ruminococcaceae bacterium]|nr:hypothetical protein [Oscillospiraceae bacterium]